MRVRQLFFAVLIITLSGACKSRSNGKGQLEITVEVAASPGETAPDMAKINTGLKTRLVNLGFEDEDVTGTVSGNRIKFVLSHFSAYPEIDRQRIRKIIQASARLELSETYEASEIYQLLVAGEEALTDSLQGPENDTLTEKPAEKQHPVFDLLFLNVSYGQHGPQYLPGPEIGLVRMADTAQFRMILLNPAIKNRLPAALRFAWANDDTDKNQDQSHPAMKLIALKNTDAGKARMSDPGIVDVEIAEDEGGRYKISVELDQPSGDIFAQMTGENDRKAIAIVLDDLVYSYPTVMGAIMGGKFEISGNFSKSEANDLASLLRARNGTGGAMIRIVQEDLIQ